MPVSFCKRTRVLMICLGFLCTSETLSVLGEINGHGNEQLLVVVDTSGSMGWPVRFRSKMAWARSGIADYLKHLPLQTGVGLLTFGGGDCRTTRLVVPIRDGNHDEILSALEQVIPSGTTPLAYALEKSIQAFDRDLKGGKTIILLTDGQEACGGDVCAAVQKLHQQSLDIRIDVVGFLLDESALRDLACVSKLTGGTFVNIESRDLPNLGNILFLLGSSILKRLIALALGLGAITAWSHLAYRFLTSISGGKRIAATAASFAGVAVLSSFAALLFLPVVPYLNLIPLPLAALGIGMAIFSLFFRRERSGHQRISLILVLALFISRAQASYGGEIQAQQHDRPQIGRDHVVCLDRSGSMEKVWRKVQAQAKAYVSSQVRDGDAFSLFAFTDRPDLLGMWHVAGEADREEIQKRMNDLHPLPRSYTVFSPLLPAIINHLKATALPEHEQVVLVVSDGERKRSPGFQGEDVPFQAIGERTLKSDGYLIAIIGGRGFNPLAPARRAPSASTPASGDGELLREWKALFSPTLTLTGQRPVVVQVQPSLLGRWPSEAPFSLHVTSPSTLPKELNLTSAVTFNAERLPASPLHLSLREGKGEIRGAVPLQNISRNVSRITVVMTLPQNFNPSVLEVPLEIRLIGWNERFSWLLWMFGGVLSIFVGAGIVQIVSRRVGVIWVADGRGEPAPLPRGGTVTIGGPGGIGPEHLPPLAQLTRRQGTKVFLEPTGLPDTAVKLNGTPITGRCSYNFGTPILCMAGGKEEQVTIARTATPRLHQAGEAVSPAQNLLGDDLL